MASKNLDEFNSMYLDTFLSTPHLQRQILASLKKVPKTSFDSIAFRGMSGALIAPILALRLRKNLIMVRKSEKESHSGMRVEGYYNSQKYIIVDDFVHSGETAAEIVSSVDQFSPLAECLGILCVSGQYTDNAEFTNLSDLKKKYRYSFQKVAKNKPKKKRAKR